MGGEHITENALDFMFMAYLKLKETNLNPRNISGKVVLDKAKRMSEEYNSGLMKDGKSQEYFHFPCNRKAHDIVMDFKFKGEQRSPEQKEVDSPWCIARLGKYPIHPETLPAVLEVFRARLVKGQDFTIRQAKWVSQFSAALHDIKTLSRVASLYAHWEEASEIKGYWPDNSLSPSSLGIDLVLFLGVPEHEDTKEKYPFAYYWLHYEDEDDPVWQRSKQRDKMFDETMKMMDEQIRKIKEQLLELRKTQTNKEA